jgi:hypothetical protein
MIFSDPNNTSDSFIDQVNFSLRGEEDAPVSGTDEYVLWTATANRKKDEWARDVKQSWSSLFKNTAPNERGTVSTAGTTTLTGTSTYFTDYQVGDTILVSGETVRTIATITSNTSLTVTVAFSTTASSLTFTHATIIKTGVQNYSLHRKLLTLSDRVSITDTNTNLNYYLPVEPQQRDIYTTNTSYVSGDNPKILTLIPTINSTQNTNLIGGTLNAPGYYLPDNLSAATDVIPVDDPYWLVYAVASEIAFNDVTYEDKYVDLNTKANNLYQMMTNSNRRGTSNNPRKVLTNVKRIYSPDTRN